MFVLLFRFIYAHQLSKLPRGLPYVEFLMPGIFVQNAIFGAFVLTIGLLLVWRMDVHTTNAQAARNMVISGVGLGLMMQVFVVSVQNASPVRALGSATALTQFARAIGATLGATLMGVIVNQGLPRAASTRQVVHRLPPGLRTQLAEALHPAFLAAVGICVIVWLIVALGIREVPLRKGFDDAPPETRIAAG